MSIVAVGQDPEGFVRNACAVMAERVNGLRLARAGDEDDLVAAYAELVIAYSHLVRRELDDPARTAILEHLVERIRQAQAGTVSLAVLDIVDRLHAELTR